MCFVSDVLYWSESYVAVDGNISDCVPVFLKELADQIFVCGKTINLLKLCSKSEVRYVIFLQVTRVVLCDNGDMIDTGDKSGTM